MDTTTLHVVIALVFVAAGVVKGISGMGLPTVAMGLLGTMMAPAFVAAVLVIPSLVTNVWQLFAGPSTAKLLRRLWPMLVLIVIGTPAGAFLLVAVDPAWSGMLLGAALLVYACSALFGREFQVPARVEPWLSPLVGLITGVVTGATGIFVFPAVPYIQSLGLGRDDLVQALGLSFTISTIALAAGLALHGALEFRQVGLSFAAVIPALLGMWLGQVLRARISPKRFKQFLLGFLAVLGAQLLARPLFA